ncbi:MAG: hypothetical protein O3B09_03170 [Proteobacteria bacterium]|nr:hypothetical protein [Pseudomonadota bacterium]
MRKITNLTSQYFSLISYKLRRQFRDFVIGCKYPLLLSLLIIINSCADQGCIEADDFGEYEYETLTVQANGSEDRCIYDPSLELTDSEQGQGLLSCFTSDSIIISDESNTSYTSPNGCYGFDPTNPDAVNPDGSILNLCIERCTQRCLASSATNSSTSEPFWVPTTQKRKNKNIGVTISPGAEISIKVTGNISLGDAKDSDAYVAAGNDQASGFNAAKLQFLDSSFNERFFDVAQGQSRSVSFSGIWRDRSDTGNASDTFVGGGGADILGTDSPTQLAQLFNGARRLVAYLVPHPDGYEFDADEASSSGNEIDGVIGTPLYADTDLWQCPSYSLVNPSNPPLIRPLPANATCNSLGYAPKYPNMDDGRDGIALSIYGITAEQEHESLGTVGGIIRWQDDELFAFDTDPFNGVTCGENDDCAAIVATNNAIPADIGGTIGDLSAANSQIVNPHDYPVRISFRSILDSNECSDVTASATVRDSADNTIYTENNVKINGSIWSDISQANSSYFTLEVGDSIVVGDISETYGASDDNCGKVIAYRFDKIHEIEIKKSGFVSFSTF